MLDQYASLYESFRWLVPTHFNIGQECCTRWANSSADARKIALFFEDGSGQRDIWTYERLGTASHQFANALVRMGVRPGDRVAIVLGQTPEAVITQLAAYLVGAVAMPLPTNLPPKALEFRLRDSETKVGIVGPEASSNLLSILSRCNKLSQVIGVGVTDDRMLAWRSLMLRQPETFKPHLTRAEDPALLLYTSETQQQARAVLLPHSALIGALPGFVAANNWFPHNADAFWTPLEWSHPSALLGALLPTLYFGRSIVGVRSAITPGYAHDLLTRYRISHALIPSTMLKQIRLSAPAEHSSAPTSLCNISINDHGLDDSLSVWCEHYFGLPPNQMFGVAEIPNLIGDSHQKWRSQAGSLGRVFPGHRIAVIKEDGTLAQVNEIGELAVQRSDASGHQNPAFPLRYWRNEPDQSLPHTNDWWLLGEQVRIDQEGFVWHVSKQSRALTKPKSATPVTPSSPAKDTPKE
jgi:acetyl-CoA synthetase